MHSGARSGAASCPGAILERGWAAATLRQRIEKAQRALGSSSQYSGEIARVYQSIEYGLAWVHNGKPSLQRHHKTAEDYGSQGARSGRLRCVTLGYTPGSGNEGLIEEGLIDFDLDLTVAAMRYISDLQFGCINPKAVSFMLDARYQTFDLADFLGLNVIRTENVNAAMVELEPPFPGYKRTLAALNASQRLNGAGGTG